MVAHLWRRVFCTIVLAESSGKNVFGENFPQKIGRFEDPELIRDANRDRNSHDSSSPPPPRSPSCETAPSHRTERNQPSAARATTPSFPSHCLITEGQPTCINTSKAFTAMGCASSTEVRGRERSKGQSPRQKKKPTDRDSSSLCFFFTLRVFAAGAPVDIIIHHPLLVLV